MRIVTWTRRTTSDRATGRQHRTLVVSDLYRHADPPPVDPLDPAAALILANPRRYEENKQPPFPFMTISFQRRLHLIIYTSESVRSTTSKILLGIAKKRIRVRSVEYPVQDNVAIQPVGSAAVPCLSPVLAVL